jgi:hypothetical protein
MFSSDSLLKSIHLKPKVDPGRRFGTESQHILTRKVASRQSSPDGRKIKIVRAKFRMKEREARTSLVACLSLEADCFYNQTKIQRTQKA